MSERVFKILSEFLCWKFIQRAFGICFHGTAVAMEFGGVSVLTNQRLYRFLVKPLFDFIFFFQRFGTDIRSSALYGDSRVSGRCAWMGTLLNSTCQ